MKMDIFDLKGSVVGELKLNESVFAIKPNLHVVRQAVLAEMVNMRQGTHASKNRALVNGGGKKPWKQKGRGVARAGTIRSPLWRGGGIVFGPQPHPYTHKLSKKTSKLARRSVLSSKMSSGDFIIVNNFSIESHKTSEFVKVLTSLKLENKKITLVTNEFNNHLTKAVGNLSNVCMVNVLSVSTYELIDCEVIISDQKSVEILIKMLSK